MNNPTVFMFSGQGSHYYQMGKEFMHENAVFTYWMKEGQSILQDLGEKPFLTELYQSPKTKAWRNLRSTHPWLVIIQYATYQVLKSEGVEANAVLGTSLGTFAAAAATGIMSFEDAVKGALLQAKKVIEHCPLGGILAVLASPDVYRNSKEFQALVSLGGINFSNHFIISGLQDPLKEAEKLLHSLGINYQELAVDYAFHSSIIDAARQPFEISFQQQVPILNSPNIPWVGQGNTIYLSQFDVIKPSFYWNAVSQSMDFYQTVLALEIQQGIRYIDVGPSGTLSTFVKYAISEDSASEIYSILTPFHQGQKNLQVFQGKRI